MNIQEILLELQQETTPRGKELVQELIDYMLDELEKVQILLKH